MEAAVRWSPFSSPDRRRFLLVDVIDSSLTLNELLHGKEASAACPYRTIAKSTKLPNLGAFAWSPNDESLVAVGLLSGNASLVQLREDKVLAEPIATFKIKQQRKCNSVALSSRNWLAVALDKTRSDVCLNIYDVGGESLAAQDPVRRLCAAELVSSVRFFPSQEQEIVASTQRSFIRIYDLRDGYFGGSSNVQVTTRNVNNIAIDPCDENYFASAGSTDDPVVTVWDKRWIAQSPAGGSSNGSVFHFAPAVDNSQRSTVWSLRYSGRQRGRLAVGASTGELRIIDMVEGKTSSLHTSDYSPHNPYGGNAWKGNRYVAESRNVEKAWYDGQDGREPSTRIIAFDWVSDDMSVGQELVTLRPNREINLSTILRAKAHAGVTARQDLSIALEDLSLTASKPHVDNGWPSAPYGQVDGAGAAEDFGPHTYDGEEDTLKGFGEDRDSYSRDAPHIGRLLGRSTVQSERCRRGYLFDCQKNTSVVAGDWQLERLWEIVGRFQEQAEHSVYDTLDLGYVGVAGIWSESIGRSPHRRLAQDPIPVEEAIVGLADLNQLPAFAGERTDFPEHRQVCLAVCGWKFTVETLETECQELIERGLYYQAIVQAVLHDYKHIALNLLRTLIRSKTVQNIGLGALLAADKLNEEQREMCLWMAADTEDPALKALLTFLTTGNWRDVMKTNYLHLGYRVALGLKYLNDTELSGFLQSETARAVRNGDLEGILLTGLGEQAMDLFQTYIVKTNDLQTAVLATAFTNPLYVDDLRWEMWKDTYFDQMQTWQATTQRARFTVQHNKLARTRKGDCLITPPENQLTLRCLHCQRSLARRADVRGSKAVQTPASSSANGKRVTGVAANAGTVCSSCGRHLPRCGVCQLWLGTPDPSKRKILPSAGEEGGVKTRDMVMAALINFCVSCGHGTHAHHAEAWFEKHAVCPVPDCRCLCSVKT